ncbi:MAG: glycine cleavage system aminomethyltransferase GcvT [Myxococcota bacterium]|nr:glycine cleavage system aminomethyltransferase GcvT [Myxococcota bacterium]
MSASLLRTPLHDAHVALGARMVDFAGFSMPVQYTSIVEEHTAVREAAGLFDVSHMGQIQLRGPSAIATAERLLTRPVASLRPGRVRYALLCNESGGVVDDVTVYRVAEDTLMLCVNASNIEKDYRWVVRHADAEVGVRNESDRNALLALQGPASSRILAEIAGEQPGQLKRYAFVMIGVAGRPALVSRTGYTGSDGFEIYLNAEEAPVVFDALLEAGRPHGLLPAGLGARDTLRLEAAMPLYGHELDDTTSPLEAGLDRFVKLEGRQFIGAEALVQQSERGLERRLVGIVLEGRGVARADYPIAKDGKQVGRVTSGAPSPTLRRSIGLAYVPPSLAEPGTPLDVVIRGKATPVLVTETPFI